MEQLTIAVDFLTLAPSIDTLAQPLRIERPGGLYHVTALGNERKAVYGDDSDRTH